jgi:hypothetical protein
MGDQALENLVAPQEEEYITDPKNEELEEKYDGI